jgi:hypothetical protein
MENDYQDPNQETSSHGNNESDFNPETPQVSNSDDNPRRPSTNRSKLATSKKQTMQKC